MAEKVEMKCWFSARPGILPRLCVYLGKYLGMESGLADIKESVEISRLPCIRNEQFFEGGKNRKRRSEENGSHGGGFIVQSEVVCVAEEACIPQCSLMSVTPTNASSECGSVSFLVLLELGRRGWVHIHGTCEVA